MHAQKPSCELLLGNEALKGSLHELLTVPDVVEDIPSQHEKSPIYAVRGKCRAGDVVYESVLLR